MWNSNIGYKSKIGYKDLRNITQQFYCETLVLASYYNCGDKV